MNFKEVFDCFLQHSEKLKVISVASCGKDLRPNCAPKMLADIVEPNRIFFLEYKYTRTHENILQNPWLSVSFMDDIEFLGYRLTGKGEIISSGKEYENAKEKWEKRLIAYEADRMLKRITGHYSTRQGENVIPKEYEIVKLTAVESAVVKADKVLRDCHKGLETS